MIWVFTRGSAQIDIEVRRCGPAAFELVVDYPDGSEKLARFTDARKLLRHTLKVQQRLIRAGWIPSPPAERAAAPRANAKTQPIAAPQRLWSRLQKRVTARFAATFGL